MDEHVCVYHCHNLYSFIHSQILLFLGRLLEKMVLLQFQMQLNDIDFLDPFRSHDSEILFPLLNYLCQKTTISFLVIYFEESLVLYFKPCQKVLLRDHCLIPRSMTHDVTQGYISFSSSTSARKLCECRMTTPNSATFYHPNINWSIWYPWMLNNLKSRLEESRQDEIKPYKSEMMLVNRKLGIQPV